MPATWPRLAIANGMLTSTSVARPAMGASMSQVRKLSQPRPADASGARRHADHVVEGRVRDAQQPHDRYRPLDEDRYERHEELRQVDEELDQADEGVQPGHTGDREERDGREPEADVGRSQRCRRSDQERDGHDERAERQAAVEEPEEGAERGVGSEVGT